MRISVITSIMPDGTVVLKYENGFSFEGYVDEKTNPTSGALTTPEGDKYYFPYIHDNIFNVFSLIKEQKLENYKINKENSDETV